jgi:FkbM family methyltransferase
MYKKLKSRMKERFPFLGRIHGAIQTAKHNLVDLHDAYAPFRRGKTIVTPYGFKFLAGNSAHHKAMQAGTFEQDETILIGEYLGRADVFVDIGANIGFYVCMARSIGKHVVAVEPQPRNLGLMYANLLSNGWEDVEVFPLGLGAHPGIATLYGISSTGASLIPGWAGAPKQFRQTITVSTLDILLGERFSGKSLFVKIDVEGAEHAVIQGGGRILDMDPKPTWMLEICFDEYYPGGHNPHYSDTFGLFWRHGYEARTADRSNRIISPSDVDGYLSRRRCDSGVVNYVFSQKSPRCKGTGG